MNMLLACNDLSLLLVGSTLPVATLPVAQHEIMQMIETYLSSVMCRESPLADRAR